MSASALFQSIRLKVPSGTEAQQALRVIGGKFRFAKASRAIATQDRLEADRVVTFRSMIDSAVVEPPRRVNWHPLALLDFALTGGIVLAGGVCGWVIINMLFGFLVW